MYSDHLFLRFMFSLNHRNSLNQSKVSQESGVAWSTIEGPQTHFKVKGVTYAALYTF